MKKIVAVNASPSAKFNTGSLVRERVPSVESIGGYARIDDFHGKAEEQLRDMAAAATGFATRG